MDYGYFNQFLGREVGENFWGTRTQHIVGVAGCLALTDHTSQALFQKVLNKELCFAKSPAAFVAHTFFFIFSGVTLYVAGDAAFNPNHEGKRLEEFKDGTYSSYVGSNTGKYVCILCLIVHSEFCTNDRTFIFESNSCCPQYFSSIFLL